MVQRGRFQECNELVCYFLEDDDALCREADLAVMVECCVSVGMISRLA